MRFTRLIVVPALFAAACMPDEATVNDAASLTGTIIDKETREPLAGAFVTTVPPTARVETDATGRYTITQGTKRMSTYQVTAEAEGFDARTSTITLELGDNRLDFELDILHICAPGTRRCTRGGPEGLETCGPRGNLWTPSDCGASDVCDEQGGTAACVPAHSLTVATQGTGGGIVVSQPSGISCAPTCTRAFPEGRTVTLTASPFALSGFAGWSGDCTGTEDTCTVTLDRERSVTARFDTTGYLLTITRMGRGRVTSTPAGINCGSMCQLGWADGTMIELRAVAMPGATFAGWMGGGCSGTAETCMITMDQDRNVRATFVTQQYELSVLKAGTGAGVVTSDPQGIDCGSDCDESYDEDTIVTLDAAPGAGATFAGWSGACTGTGPCMLTMTVDHEVTATFDGISHQVDVTLAGAGMGTVTSNPSGIDCGADCTEAFGEGQVVVFTAAPAGGSTFAGWTGDCAAAGTMPDCTLTIMAPATVGAQFDVGTFDVTVAVTGMGTVTSNPPGINCGADCTEAFAGGTPITLTAMAGASPVFGGWGGDCSAAGLTATCNLTVSAARNVSASFHPFFFGPLPADASCTTLLHFNAPAPLAQACGGGAPATATGTYTSITSRSLPLQTAFAAGGPNEDEWIDTAKLGPAPPEATIELTVRKAGAAFNGRTRGVLYSNHDALDAGGPGVRLYVTNDGRFGAETADGAGGTRTAETPAGTITDGTWYHLAATISSSTGIALYVDAASAGSVAGLTPFAASSSTAYAGAEREGAVGAIDRFNGAVDELRVSNVLRY